MQIRRVLTVVGLCAVTVAGSVALPGAAGASNPVVVARDLSYPQCGAALPRAGASTMGVLGTNGGMSFTDNPCLVTELAWAKRLPGAPAFYANTGNPGPGRGEHWPIGQTSPQLCSASEPNSLACSFDYGWNAASQSYRRATAAAQLLHKVDWENASHRAANVDWWLDVETMNSWQTTDGSYTRAEQDRDVATIAGEMDALHNVGVAEVGIYSTVSQWTEITGNATSARARFAGVPQWLAGYDSPYDAAAACGHDGFTGGPVRLTQYLGKDGFDADVVCR